MSTTKKGQKKLNKKESEGKRREKKRRILWCFGFRGGESEVTRGFSRERERERLRFGLMGVVLSINPFYSRF
jgi:hypothetical protein